MSVLIERHGIWHIAVGEVDQTATFDGLNRRRVAAGFGLNAVESLETSACVEVLQFGGGITPRALLGATFSPGGSELLLEVASSGPMTIGSSRECRSNLGGPLVTGLPTEFVEPVIDAMFEMAAKVERPAGTLRVSAAGYDEEHSSPHAFAHAGAGLLWVACRQALVPSDPIDGLTELAAIW